MGVEFLLRYNYFFFNGNYYLQRCGASMGARFSPSLANIYMAAWEERFLLGDNNPFASHIRWYGRFIDDLLLVWEGTPMDALAFVDYINSNDMNLKFTHIHDNKSVHFLDITLVGNNEDIEILPFTKSMARNTLLLATSCHASHTIRNLPIGEFIRIKRNCSDAQEYDKQKLVVKNKLLARSYPQWSIDRAMARVQNIQRESLFGKKPKVKLKPIENKITFSTIYSPQFPSIVAIIKKHLPLLSIDDTIRKIIPNGIQYVSSRAPTLGTILSPSLFLSNKPNNTNWLTTKGFHKCGHNICTACRFAENAHTFCSLGDGKSHEIKSYINCNTKYVIYLISCTECNIQYVGCTKNALKIRIRRHLSDVNKAMALNVSSASRHFQQVHNNNLTSFKFMGIERVSRPIRGGRLAQETAKS